jgi:hypothetical protein
LTVSQKCLQIARAPVFRPMRIDAFQLLKSLGITSRCCGIRRLSSVTLTSLFSSFQATMSIGMSIASKTEKAIPTIAAVLP